MKKIISTITKIITLNILLFGAISASNNIELFLKNLTQDKSTVTNNFNISLIKFTFPLGFNSIQTREINRLKTNFVSNYDALKANPIDEQLKASFKTSAQEFEEYLSSLQSQPAPSSSSTTTPTSVTSTATPLPAAPSITSQSEPSAPAVTTTSTAAASAQPGIIASMWRYLGYPSSASSSAEPPQPSQEDSDRALALQIAREEAAHRAATTSTSSLPSAQPTDDPDVAAAIEASNKQLIYDDSPEAYIPVAIPEAARRQTITGQPFVNPIVINISDKVAKQRKSTCGYHSYKNLSSACTLCKSGDLIDIVTSEPTFTAGSRDIESEQFPISNWKKIVQDYRTTKGDRSTTKTLTWDEILHLVNLEGKIPNGSLIVIPNILSFINDVSDKGRINSVFASTEPDEVNKLKLHLGQLISAIREIQNTIASGLSITYTFALCDIDSRISTSGHWRAYVVDVKHGQATIYVMDSARGANSPPYYGNEPRVLNALIEILNQDPDILQATIQSVLE